MRMLNGEIPLIKFHFERISNTAAQFNYHLGFDFEAFEYQIKHSLAAHQHNSRIRVGFRIDHQRLLIGEITIEEFSPAEYNPTVCLTLCIYDQAFKSIDALSNSKIMSKLLYEDSIYYAESRGYDQAIILNHKNEIVETSRCNIFFVQNDQIYTPALRSGGVNGIQRKLLIEKFSVIETLIYRSDLADFSEIFLSNAVRGIIKVNRLEDRDLPTDFTEKLRPAF